MRYAVCGMRYALNGWTVALQGLFYSVLGLVCVTAAVVFGASLSLQPLLDASYFRPSSVAGWLAALAQLAAAPVLALGVLRLVARAKRVRDFVATTYGFHLIATAVYTGGLPRELLWWAAFAAGLWSADALGWQLCSKQDLEPVEFGQAGRRGHATSGSRARRSTGAPSSPLPLPLPPTPPLPLPPTPTPVPSTRLDGIATDTRSLHSRPGSAGPPPASQTPDRSGTPTRIGATAPSPAVLPAGLASSRSSSSSVHSVPLLSDSDAIELQPLRLH